MAIKGGHRPSVARGVQDHQRGNPHGDLRIRWRRRPRNDATVELPPACVLIRRDGLESPIEDSSAPIHDRRGKVTGAVMVFHDVGKAQALTRELAYVAQHDSLTDLPNRSLLLDRLGQALAAAKRHQTTAALLYLDLDRFKPINDSLGPPRRRPAVAVGRAAIDQ